MRRLLSHPWAGVGLVLLATFAAYAPSLASGFAMDDGLVAVGVRDDGQPNRRIAELQPLAVYFSTPYWGDTNERDVLYRPLTILSFALRHHLVGDAAWAAHLANILLHLLAVALVYGLVRALGVDRPIASFAAALFGLHAVHSEVVANVVGRSELLAFTLGAGALLLWIRSEGSGGLRRILATVSAALLLFGALCSKESALAWVGFFFVFALALGWRSAGAPLAWKDVGRLALRVAVVSALPIALFLLLRHRMLAGQGVTGIEVAALVNPVFDAPAPVRIYTATVVLAYGLLLVAAPFRLAADYSIAVFEIIGEPWHPKFLGAATLLLGVGLGALWVRRRHPLLFLAAAAFFGFSLVTSNLLFPIGTIFGERLLYAPSLAVPLLGAWAAERVRGPAGHARIRRALLLIAGAWLGASTLVIVQRNPVWRDDPTLFLHEVGNQPRSVRMQVNAASVHHDRGELEAAAHHLEEAVELDPEHALSWNNLAAIRLEQGRLEEAERSVRRGLEADHLVEDRDLFKLHCNLGLILVRGGRERPGVDELARCLWIEPAFLRPWKELAGLEARGVLTVEDLAEVLERGETESPASPYWSLYRGLLAHRTGRHDEAVDRLDHALERIPRHGAFPGTRAEGRLARADALLRLGRQTRALEELKSLAGDPAVPGQQRQVAQNVVETLK